jgi:hypothetical protein
LALIALLLPSASPLRRHRKPLQRPSAIRSLLAMQPLPLPNPRSTGSHRPSLAGQPYSRSGPWLRSGGSPGRAFEGATEFAPSGRCSTRAPRGPRRRRAPARPSGVRRPRRSIRAAARSTRRRALRKHSRARDSSAMRGRGTLPGGALMLAARRARRSSCCRCPHPPVCKVPRRAGRVRGVRAASAGRPGAGPVGPRRRRRARGGGGGLA